MSLLEILRAGEACFLSGEELARQAGISRAAIWKRVEDLRAQGYEIEARPHQGYRLISAPDIPYPEEIQTDLAAVRFGRPAMHFSTIGSTNDLCRKLGAEGWPEGTTVAAEIQTAGRGRLGRAWLSISGGLWFSLIVRPNLALADLGPLTMTAAAALRRAVEENTGIKPLIKWPNDLVVSGRKLAGILAEASGELGRVEFVVIGIGLNVNQDMASFPPEIRRRTVTLRALLGCETRRLPILRSFLLHFERLYDPGLRDGFRATLADAAAYSATLGRKVRISSGGAIISGDATRLDPDGALVLRTTNGPVAVHAGEIEEARLD